MCCLCDFPLEPRAKNGWADHAFKAEHLFLENIYSGKQMVSMGIDKFEHFSKKLNQILDEINSFCASIESESISSNPEIDEIVEKIKKKLKLLEMMITKRPSKKQSLFYVETRLNFYLQKK